MSAVKNYWDSVSTREYGVVSHETLALCRQQADRELHDSPSTPRSRSRSAVSATGEQDSSQDDQASQNRSSKSSPLSQKTRESGMRSSHPPNKMGFYQYEARYGRDENWFDPA